LPRAASGQETCRNTHEKMKQMKYQINVDKAIREAAEKIVARGTVEKEWERILISTAAKLCALLFDKTMDDEWAKQARALQDEMGFFLPSLTEAVFVWVREDKIEMVNGIRLMEQRMYESQTDTGVGEA
jgi:hypothetical protein